MSLFFPICVHCVNREEVKDTKKQVEHRTHRAPTQTPSPRAAAAQQTAGGTPPERGRSREEATTEGGAERSE